MIKFIQDCFDFFTSSKDKQYSESMTELKSKILREIHQTQKKLELYESQFDTDDIRISIFDGFHSALSSYYCSVDLHTSNHFLEANREIFSDKKIELKNLETQILTNTNKSNAYLLLSSWSEFELFIDSICLSILTPEQQSKCLGKKHLEISKKVKREVLETQEINITNELNSLESLKIKNFHLLPSMNKIETILRMIKSSYAFTTDYDKDRMFLNNYGRLRNCIHSNFVYHGNKEIRYPYDGIEYIFIPEKPIDIIPKEDDTFLNNLIHLREISERIVQNLDHKGLIVDLSFSTV